MNRLLNRLLGCHISAGQLAGFVLANLCGMAIVLTAIQFFGDLRPLLTSSDSFLRPGHIVVTKRVTSLGTLTGASPTFSDREIERLRQQPFTRRLGCYTPAQFSVFATIGGGNMPVQFSTDMFLEAVPDEFIDTSLERWTYDPASYDVPIILPRTYLNLYNFGFASSQGLPTISEEIASAITINLRLTGTTTLLKTGRVVAFSRRLNTILVPQAFLDDMNSRLAPDASAEPSRLILQVDNPADERIADYLDRYNYDTEAADADAARATSLMRIVVTIVLAVGLIIAALSFYVLLLSIFLILQKHTEQVDNLLLIGYSPASLQRPFFLLTVALNLGVLIAAIAAVAVARSYYLPLLRNLYDQLQPSSMITTIVTGVAIFIAVTLLNYVAIRSKVRNIWHMHQ